MKKLLLALVCIMALSAVDASAQRKTGSYDIRVGAFDGTVTYSYIPSDGKTIYDGPVTIKAADEHWNRTSYGTLISKRDYSFKANNSDGVLHGAVTMKDHYSSRWSGDTEEVTTRSFTANYVYGMPHGRFLLDVKEKKDGTTRQSMCVDATYTNGILTGSFKLMKSQNEYDDCNVQGAFNSAGQLDGKWVINSESYQFKNGVQIKGSGMSKSAEAADISMKFATNQMTESDVLERGLMVITTPFRVRGRDIYDQVAHILGWGVLVFNETCLKGKDCKADGAISHYARLIDAPYFAGNGFNECLSRFANSDEYMDDSRILKQLDGTDICYVEFHSYYNCPYSCANADGWLLQGSNDSSKIYGYILTKEQEALLRKTINETNERIDKERAEEAIRELKRYYLDEEITINNVQYKILDIRSVSYARSGDVEVDVDVRTNEDVPNDNYFVRTFRAKNKANVNNYYNYKPEIEITSRIRNKYDDVEAAMNAYEAAEDATIAILTPYLDDYEVAKHPGVERQSTTFADYYGSLEDINIDHNNLDATIKKYNDNTMIIRGFNTFIQYYIEACKLDNKLKTTVAQHTLTPLPELIDWQATSDSNKQATLLKDIKSAIINQKQLLEDWDVYCQLKEQVISDNSAITASGSNVLAEYNAMYKGLFSGKKTLNDGIAAFNNFIEVQNSVKKYIAQHDAVVAANTNLKVALKPAKCAAKAYKAYYSALDLTWKPEGAFEQLEEVADKQSALKSIAERPTLADDEKRVKKMKLTNLDDIIKAYNATSSAM